MAKTNLSILDIADSVGFESQSKFTAMFHATLGLTPTEFRRNREPTPVKRL
ncbi:MAG: helix-turn-helix domain-containing protein [Lachnospiraceae bacterium]|nr:helix-turn-helix domain-containing protein [Lachnospiraceae bacterium]